MLDYLFDVFAIGSLIMLFVGGFVFTVEKIINKFPKIKYKLENMYR